MNAAASRLHGRIHAKALFYFMNKFKEIDWSIDEDLFFDDEEGKLRFRPDIIGRDKEDNIVYGVEVSVSTLKKDLGIVKSLFREKEVLNYFVIDCNHEKVFHFKLEENEYRELEGSELSMNIARSVFA